MPSFWKKVFGRKKKKKAALEEPAPIAEVEEPASIAEVEEPRPEPESVVLAENVEYETVPTIEQAYRSPISPNSWDVRPMQTFGNVHTSSYDPTDAFGTMGGLLQNEVEDLTPQMRLRQPAFGTTPQAQSMKSLSTISARAGPDGSAAGTVQQVDNWVRRSLNSKGRQSIPVGIVNPDMHQREPGDHHRPLYLHQSYSAEPVYIATQEEQNEYPLPPLPTLPQSPPRPPSTQQPLSPARVLSPRIIQDQLTQSPAPLSPLPPLTPQNPGSPPYTIRSSKRSSPRAEAIGSPSSRKHQSLGLSLRQEESPKPLSPIQNLPLEEVQPEEDPVPPSAPPRVDEYGRMGRASTVRSFQASKHSRTYNRALTEPTPIKDQLPHFNPYAPPPPRPRWQPPSRAAPPPRAAPPALVRVEESNGMALTDAKRALYGGHRPATERFYWSLSPDHDPRVATMLNWVNAMRGPLGTFGLHKYLGTRSRGALLLNIEYWGGSHHNTPAVDWIPFAKAQGTRDVVFQEGIASYDPATTTLVYAFLLSKTRRSMAIWRRKLDVPEITRRDYAAEIEHIKAELAGQELLIHVDPSPEQPAGQVIYPRGRRPLHPAFRTPPPEGSIPWPDTMGRAPVTLGSESTHEAPPTSTVVHEFGTTSRQPAVHIFGKTPSSQALSPPATTIVKKRKWWKRIIPGRKSGKPKKEKKMGRVTSAVVSHVDWT